MTLENIFSLLTLLVAAAAAVGAFYSVYTARKTAKQRTTLEFLEEYQREMRAYKDRLLAMGAPQNIKDFSSVIGSLMGKIASQKDIDISSIAPELMEKMGQTDFFMVFLNKREKLAIGLKHKIYDEKMIFDALALELVELHELSKPFVAQIREKMKSRSKHYERVFINFEELVEKAKACLAQK